MNHGRYLFVLNDAPYVADRSYQALRLATNLLKREPKPEVKVFLLGEGARCAKKGHQRASGEYNIEIMLQSVTKRGGLVVVCGTCMDARKITDEELVATTRRGTLDELTEWTVWAEKALVF